MREKICQKCGLPKPLNRFVKNKQCRDGRAGTCQACTNKRTIAKAYKRRENGFCWCGKEPLPGKKLCKRCTQRTVARPRANRKKGLCGCGKPVSKGSRCQNCVTRHDKWTKQLRQELLVAYGGKCACPCGCTVCEPEFLNLDHVNGGGRKQRRESKVQNSGTPFYSWLRKHGFPKDKFRLLCWNCNCARGIYGYCPREKAKQMTYE